MHTRRRQRRSHRRDREIIEWYESRTTAERPVYGIDELLRAGGYYRIPDVAMRSSKGAAITLAMIMDHCNGHGNCWPGLDRITSLAHQSRRTTIRHINRLVSDGHLAKVRRRQSSNRYHVPAKLFRSIDAQEKQFHGRLPKWWIAQSQTIPTIDRTGASLTLACILDQWQMLDLTETVGCGLDGRDWISASDIERDRKSVV